jgi:DNA topoisomerase VI subunit B
VGLRHRQRARHNGIDAAEEDRVMPDVSFTVCTAKHKGSITVTDNASGIPADTVDSLLDFSVRVSSREAYVAPTRGAQGNALKTIIMMPHVLLAGGKGKAEPVVIEACGIRHSISISVDAVQQKPVAVHEQERSKKKNGTTITVPWPNVSLLKLRAQKAQFLQIVHAFAMLNPHASFRVDWDGERAAYKAIDPDFSKWTPRDHTAPRWYDGTRFARLLGAYANENGSRTVREFVSEFRGLTGSAKVAEVLDATNLARVTVGEMFTNGKPSPRINRLLLEMHQQTSAVKATDLGVIGKENLRLRFEALGADLESFQYKRMLGDADAELPYVIEVAFAYVPAEINDRVLVTGINFSPAIVNPFRQLGSGGEGLERVLAGQRVEAKDPVVVMVHFTCPVITYLDRGKSAVALKGEEAESGLKNTETFVDDPKLWMGEVFTARNTPAGNLVTAVKAVTKRWYKQRKAEERDSSAYERRVAAMRASRKVSQTKAAAQVMVEAYMKASANDTLPANVRQIMYAARKAIEELSQRPLKDTYFTQTLLPDYITKHQPPWRDNVVYDDRGHFVEPHTGKMIGLGTLNVRQYLDDVRDPVCEEAFAAQVKTFGPKGRYCGIFFAEKEGFDPLFERMQLEQRHDLAFMSTKGLSVTAARLLVDRLCAKCDIPLFLLRDFDKSGFVGAATFQKNNRRYTYENIFQVYDLGLRLDDVYDLIARFPELGDIDALAENTHDKGKAATRRVNLEENGATPEEIAFLVHDDADDDADDGDDAEDDVGDDGRKKRKTETDQRPPRRTERAAVQRAGRLRRTQAAGFPRAGNFTCQGRAGCAGAHGGLPHVQARAAHSGCGRCREGPPRHHAGAR